MSGHNEVAVILNQVTATLTASSKQHDLARNLLTKMAELVTQHGAAVAATCMALAPLALARGESREELRDMVSRFEQQRPYNGYLMLDPKAEFPVEVVGTGQFSPDPTSFTLRRGRP